MADDDWFDGGGHGASVDVPALLDSAGGQALWDLVAAGALVGLGLTRDRGALGVTITVDGRWRREYFREADDLQMWMSEAVPAVTAALERLAASSDAGRRARGRKGL